MRAGDRRAHRGPVRGAQLMAERRNTTPGKGVPRAPSSASIPSAPPSMPPSTFDLDHQDAVTLKGIAGSPGVAVGPALVLGDLRASFVRRHIHTAQIQSELDRVQQGVEAAKSTLRAVDARMPAAMREASAILEAYQMMLS